MRTRQATRLLEAFVCFFDCVPTNRKEPTMQRERKDKSWRYMLQLHSRLKLSKAATKRWCPQFPVKELIAKKKRKNSLADDSRATHLGPVPPARRMPHLPSQQMFNCQRNRNGPHGPSFLCQSASYRCALETTC